MSLMLSLETVIFVMSSLQRTLLKSFFILPENTYGPSFFFKVNNIKEKKKMVLIMEMLPDLKRLDFRNEMVSWNLRES